jgi:uncharacterized protein (TIGR02118 family)
MIKLMALFRRPDGMSVDKAQKHWLEVHAPLVALTPGLRRYIQSHSIPELYGTDLSPAFDGLAELWFDSLEALREAQRSPEWRTAVRDAPNFIGQSKSLVATEVPSIDAFPSARERESMVKYSGFLTRKKGMSVEDFQAHWRDVHGPLVVAEIPGMRRYVQSHALPETYNSPTPPAFDGVPQAWFDSLDVYPRRLGAPRTGPSTTPGGIDSENTFEQPIPAMVAREIVIVE